MEEVEVSCFFKRCITFISQLHSFIRNMTARIPSLKKRTDAEIGVKVPVIAAPTSKKTTINV